MGGSAVDGEVIVLAALLHDVGKLWQRTGAPPPTGYEGFDRTDVGPHGAHARWSAACYQQIVPSAWREGGHLVLTHHKPTTDLAWILAVADRLAATEREDQDGTADPRAARLLSVFGQINRPAGASWPDASFPLAPLDLRRETIYPRTDYPPATADEYRRLWDAFMAEAAGLAALAGFRTYLAALLALLEKYTWCVPSAAYRSRPDVSLYDHARITAALAACLWQSQLPLAVLQELGSGHAGSSPAWTTPRFALLAGDLSGVQRFLYTIASRGAARTLRGRSLFLQLLSEAAADFVLRVLDLPVTNLLYVGGAKFYVLAPIGARDSLPELRRRLDGIFLEIAGGELALVLDATPLSARDVAERFNEAWSAVGAQLAEAKTRRFGAVARSHYAALFGPAGSGGPVSAGESCDVCGRALAEDEPARIRDGVLRCERCFDRPAPAYQPVKICVVCRAEVARGERREGSIVCAQCDGFRDLGELIGRAEALFLTVSDAELPPEAPAWQRALARLGRLWELDRRPHLERPGAVVWAVNDPGFRQAGAHGFRLSAAVTPTIQPHEHPPELLEPGEDIRPGMAKSFEWLARNARGAPYLAVLRMDVDGLGGLFRTGLGDFATPSRLASLSRSLRLFFEGWLGPLVRQVDRELGGPGEQLAVIYAGGDDLFIVGPWDRLPTLAYRIRRELAAYSGGNPTVTISAGLVVADPHYPLYLLADEAKQALDDQAKAYRRPDGRAKDALCFLGTVLGWEDADTVFGSVSELEQLVSAPAGGSGGPPPVPRALVHGLSRAAEAHRQHLARERGSTAGPAATPRLYYGRWLWMAHYQIHRLAERIAHAPTRQRVQELASRLLTPERIGWLGLIARWAEYLVRQEER